MSPVTIGLLAVSMSVDAFIAALGRGASHQTRGLANALKIGAVFGLVEAITPLVGWAFGMAASQYVQLFDHWIAFGLLTGVGLRMIFHALSRSEDAPRPTGSPLALLATAIGTSIDAMAVGVSLAFLEVNIVIIAAAIGMATLVLSATGTLAGRFIGRRFGKIAEVLGGLVLSGMGITILFDHMQVL
ncbi:MAG: manganese efflux pump MntP family protein [Qingshengfaniella sp.]